MTYQTPTSHEELFRTLAIANKEKKASTQRIKELQEHLGIRKLVNTYQVDPSEPYALSNVYPEEP